MTKDRILVVDDELDAVDALMKALDHEGFEAHYARDGVEALEMVQKSRFQLVLLDVMMPRLNGYSVLQSMLKNEATANIPVIFVTAYFNTDEVVKGLEAGAVDAISKPFRIAEVIIRSKLRIAESKLKKRFSPIAYFFAEAQEKEQSRRTGVFEFYDKSRSKIGDVYIEDGKVVYATSKDAIKEDAFLQLASNRELTYLFQDDVHPPKRTLGAPITSLILEASKIIDELDAKELRNADEKRVLIIDRNRIPRILASRSLKAKGFATKVMSSEEITPEIYHHFDPDLLIIDHNEGQEILDKMMFGQQNARSIPVVSYTDQEQIDDTVLPRIGTYRIDAILSKTNIDYALPHLAHQLIKKTETQ